MTIWNYQHNLLMGMHKKQQKCSNAPCFVVNVDLRTPIPTRSAKPVKSPSRQGTAGASVSPPTAIEPAPTAPRRGIDATPEPAVQPVAAQPGNNGFLALVVIGIAAGIVSWFRYLYLRFHLVIIRGGIVVQKSEKNGACFIIAVLAILTGLACILSDWFTR